MKLPFPRDPSNAAARSILGALGLSIVALLGLLSLIVFSVASQAESRSTTAERRAVTVVDEDHFDSIAEPLSPTLTPSVTPEPVQVKAVEPAPAIPAGPQPTFPVQSAAVAIFEANCGTMLYQKDAHTRMAPASLTKMMTILVSVHTGIHPMNLVRPGISAVELKQRTRSSVMGLSPDMLVTIQDLYFGLMLPSGNDAAIALAQASGSYDGFVQSMNEMAVFYGLTNTHFTNPHGLDNPELYSTAYDLLVLERMMMEHPYAAWVAGMPYYTTVHGELGFNNGNKLLTSYPGTIGGKIGYTGKAGHTIAVTVERRGRRLDMVVLGSAVKFEEPMKLLDWAFNETSPAC